MNEMVLGPLPDGSAVLMTRDQEHETRFTEIRSLPEGRVIGSIRWSENWSATKAVRSGGRQGDRFKVYCIYPVVVQCDVGAMA